jgi:hypothetical protein
MEKTRVLPNISGQLVALATRAASQLGRKGLRCDTSGLVFTYTRKPSIRQHVH